MYIYYEIEKKLYHNYYPFAAAPFPATINERDINDTCCNDTQGWTQHVTAGAAAPLDFEIEW